MKPLPDVRAWKTYLITFSCYGQHLHGDERGSVDRWHNQVGGRFADPSQGRLEASRNRMSNPAFRLDAAADRVAVLQAVREVCRRRGWLLEACHVRTTHVHVVVASDAEPKRMTSDFKAYASRALNASEPTMAKRWARGGSAKRVSQGRLMNAVRYVLEGQGNPMAVWPKPRDRRPSNDQSR